MQRLSPKEWIAIAAHRLSVRWRHVDPEQLDELAADLYRDETLQELEPDVAAAAWLAPLESAAPRRAG